MATDTAQVSPPVRQDPRQVVNTLKRTLNYDDSDIAAAAFDNALPLGAFITKAIVEIVTAFDGTPTVTVGTNSTTYNDIVASGDIDATLTGVYDVTRALGRSLAASAAKGVYGKLAATSPTQGQAVIVITYEGGWSS